MSGTLMLGAAWWAVGLPQDERAARTELRRLAADTIRHVGPGGILGKYIAVPASDLVALLDAADAPRG